MVHRAWKLHYDHIQHSLTNAFYQGWDLHPAQLPTRYAAVYAFFLESLDAASERLKNFVEKAAKATLVGDVFDDAATGQGLLNYFLRAINCGALTEEEAVELSGLTVAELRSGSFVKILNNRQKLVDGVRSELSSSSNRSQRSALDRRTVRRSQPEATQSESNSELLESICGGSNENHC